MNKLLFVLLFALTPLWSLAQVTGEVALSYVSTYTFRGTKVSDAAIQPSLELALGNAYATIWNHQPTRKAQDSELDLTVGYGANVETFSWDVGATAYHYPDLPAGQGLDRTTVEPYLGVTKSLGAIEASVYAYHDFSLKAQSYQGSLHRNYSLGERLNLQPRAGLGFVRGGGTGYTFWDAGVEASYAVTSRLSSYLGGNYTSSDIKGIERDIWSYNVGLRASF